MTRANVGPSSLVPWDAKNTYLTTLYIVGTGGGSGATYIPSSSSKYPPSCVNSAGSQ